MRAWALTHFLVLGLSCAGVAQTPTPAPGTPTAASSTPKYTLHVSTRLVVLDAFALDAKGNLVTDLKKDDFRVEEAGEPQIIRGFYGPGAFDVKPGVSIESTADLDAKARQAPVNIVVLDEFDTRFEDMAFARDSLKKWLQSQPDKLTSPTMLCAGGIDRFTVLRDYTQNKDALLAALDHHFAEFPWQIHNFSWVEERRAQVFRTLSLVAQASLGHPGHKNMIWIGHGFPSFNTPLFGVDNDRGLQDAVQRAINDLRDARVTLYAIDPAGAMISAAKYGEADYLFNPNGGDSNFEHIAAATGGRSIHGRNDVDASVGTAIRDSSSLYTISYQPAQQRVESDKFRSIRVTVDRPGVTVYTRQGYYLVQPPARAIAGESVSGVLQEQLDSAARSNMNYDAVRFTVTSQANDPGALQLHLSPETIVWYYVPDGSKPRWMSALLLVATFDKKNKMLDEKLMKLAVAAPTGMQQDGGPMHLPVEQVYKLEPNSKVTRVRLVVRMEANGRMGTVDFTPGGPVHASSYAAAPATAQTASAAAPSH